MNFCDGCVTLCFARRHLMGFDFARVASCQPSQSVTSLRVPCGAQTLSDNLILYSYQQWESKEDFYEYIKSDTVQPLAEYIKENVRRKQKAHTLMCVLGSAYC